MIEHLKCVVCSGEFFSTQSAQLNTRMMTLLGLDWLNESADVYVCRDCGFVHWFLPPATRVRLANQKDECLSCGTGLKVGETACSNCGWSWNTKDDS